MEGGAVGTQPTDKEYFYGKLSLITFFGREQGNVAPPREWGMTVSASSDRRARPMTRVRAFEVPTDGATHANARGGAHIGPGLPIRLKTVRC